MLAEDDGAIVEFLKQAGQNLIYTAKTRYEYSRIAAHIIHVLTHLQSV